MSSWRLVFLIVGIVLIGSALVVVSTVGPKQSFQRSFQDLMVTETPSAPGETEVPDVTVPPTPVAPTAVPPTSLPLPTPTPGPLAPRFAPPFPAAPRVLGIHVVQPRESLYCIARAYGVSPDAIARQNGLRRNAGLLIGQVLEIPDRPWWSFVPGETCPPQFAVPTTYAPVVTPYPTVDPSYGSNSPTNLASPTPTPSVETRTVEVTGPKEMPQGASDEVVLTFKPQPAGPVAPTPTPSTETPEPAEPLTVSGPLGVPDVFDHCQITATARLDAVGFDFSPSNDTMFLVRKGFPLSWRWSIKPSAVGEQKFIVSLRLEFGPTGSQPCPGERQLWSDSFDVQVVDTNPIELSSSYREELAFWLGLLSTAVGIVGDIRPLLGGLLGRLTRNKTEPKKGETSDKEESKNGGTRDKEESKNG